jgi:hypothetical protein
VDDVAKVKDWIDTPRRHLGPLVLIQKNYPEVSPRNPPDLCNEASELSTVFLPLEQIKGSAAFNLTVCRWLGPAFFGWGKH